MRLLIVTQKVDQDDSYFGFFHTWLRAFAKAFEQVTVITLERRNYALPENVTVHSLGKEHGSSRLTRLLRFWAYAWKERNAYDAVFCHMSPLYVIAGYPIWKLSRKNISLWYSHRHVDLKLRVAVRLADVVFSTTPEAFGIRTPKAQFVGHAVDAEYFKRPEGYGETRQGSVVTVGRITPIKRLEVLINALGILRRQGTPVPATLVGAPLVASDVAYAAELERLVREEGLSDSVVFAGSIPFARIREDYWKSAVSVNLAPSGGMDKAVLEAAAAGTPVIVANRAFAPLLEGYAERSITDGSPEDVAHKIEALLSAADREEIGRALAERVRANYSFASLMRAIASALDTTR